MKTELSCGIVRDLLPGYAEKLTGLESTEAVKAHLATCPQCRALYQQMTDNEPPQPETAEIDYLKKVRRSRRRGWIWAVCALVLAAGIFTFFRIQAAHPRVTYDAASKTVVVSGTGGYEDMKLPRKAADAVNLDAQDDSFHLSVYLPVLRMGEEDPQTFLPGYLERTDQSLQFLREYLKEHAGAVYSAEAAEKFVELNIRRRGDYGYANEDDRILIDIGDYYWHREELYLLALMDTDTVEWAQLGYANYLGFCVDPYSEYSTILMEVDTNSPYYRPYADAGGSLEKLTPADNRKLQDAASWLCLTRGMGWGTAYESQPLSETGLFTGERRAVAGNGMSVCMATSFIGWLVDNYGFDRVSAFCFGQQTFPQALGVAYADAYGAWSDWILTTYGE